MDTTVLRTAVALLACLVVGSLVLLGLRFLTRLPHARRRDVARVWVPPIVLGALGLAGVIGGNGWGLYVSLGDPGGPPPSRLFLYLVSMSAVFVAILWAGYAQRRVELQPVPAGGTVASSGRPANLPRDPSERDAR